MQKLRDNLPVEKKIDITIDHNGSFTDTQNPLFDGLYAMALEEASLNCVDNIKDGAYSYGQSYPIDAFETGENGRTYGLEMLPIQFISH